MKHKKILILSLLLALVITGKSQIEITVQQPIQENFVESELISEISFIPLSYEKMGAIAPDMELKVDGENYFILDNKFTQSVFRFNNQGELLDTITTQKRDTGQKNLPLLNNPSKFSINATLKQVEIFNFENLALSRFSYSGKKIDQVFLPVAPSDFIRDQKGNYWLYTGWNNKESQFRLIHADKNGKVIDRQLRLVSKCTPFESYAFSTHNNNIYLWELLGNSTYKINNNTAVETYFLNFGQKNLPASFHSMDPYDSYIMINRLGYFSTKKYLENDNFAYFFLNYTTETGREIYHVIYDKKTKKAYNYFENAGISAFEKAQYLTDNDELVFLVAPRKIRQLATSENDNLGFQFDEIVEAANSVKNTMIVKLKLVSAEVAEENPQPSPTE